MKRSTSICSRAASAPIVFSLGVALALSCTACTGGHSTAPAASAGSSGAEPALVITDQAEWDALTTAGEVSFDRACGTCHPGGDADLGPALKGHRLSSSEMTRQIREGSGRMKPIEPAELPEEQLRGLLVYLATLQAVGDIQGPAH
jgi:mono/diheme cytochrome c family protein